MKRQQQNKISKRVKPWQEAKIVAREINLVHTQKHHVPWLSVVLKIQPKCRIASVICPQIMLRTLVWVAVYVEFHVKCPFSLIALNFVFFFCIEKGFNGFCALLFVQNLCFFRHCLYKKWEGSSSSEMRNYNAVVYI